MNGAMNLLTVQNYYWALIQNAQIRPLPYQSYQNFYPVSYSPSEVYKTFLLQNLELLSGKDAGNLAQDSEKEKEDELRFLKKKRRTTKTCTACPHKNAVHYAKNMCSNCYHSRGRTKKPWNCIHKNKAHYALGLCQNCYQMNYIKKQVEQESSVKSTDDSNADSPMLLERVLNNNSGKKI